MSKKVSEDTRMYREWLFKLLLTNGGRHGPLMKRSEHRYFNRAMQHKHTEIEIVRSDYMVVHNTVITDKGRTYIMRNMSCD